jgi:hypothetical protein
MIDIEARSRAAELIEKFSDGRLSNFDFEESWPRYDRRGHALRAIETMLWRFYSDGYEHTLVEDGYILTAEGRQIFDRCILFLRTDLEYRWLRDNFLGIGGLGLLGRVLTLGLSVFLDRALQRSEERRLTELQVIGANAVWPFFTTAEFVQHCHATSAR